MQFWIYRLQKPPEVLTLELVTELPPLCHISEGLLRKQQNREPLQVMVPPKKAPFTTGADTLNEVLLSTYWVLGPGQGKDLKKENKPASDTVAALQ